MASCRAGHGPRDPQPHSLWGLQRLPGGLREGCRDVSSLTHGLHHPRPALGTDDAGPVVIHCIEASALSYQGLLELREEFPFEAKSSVWSIHHLAASSESGTVQFTADCDTELCSMGATLDTEVTTTVSVRGHLCR